MTLLGRFAGCVCKYLCKNFLHWLACFDCATRTCIHTHTHIHVSIYIFSQSESNRFADQTQGGPGPPYHNHGRNFCALCFTFIASWSLSLFLSLCLLRFPSVLLLFESCEKEIERENYFLLAPPGCETFEKLATQKCGNRNLKTCTCPAWVRGQDLQMEMAIYKFRLRGKQRNCHTCLHKCWLLGSQAPSLPGSPAAKLPQLFNFV